MGNMIDIVYYSMILVYISVYIYTYSVYCWILNRLLNEILNGIWNGIFHQQNSGFPPATFWASHGNWDMDPISQHIDGGEKILMVIYSSIAITNHSCIGMYRDYILSNGGTNPI